MALDDAEVVLEMVQQWRAKPKKWRRLVRELLVVLWNIRPVVFLDEVAFASLEAVGAFVAALNDALGCRWRVLTFQGDDDGFSETAPSVFIASAAALETWSDSSFPVFASPNGQRLSEVDEKEIQRWVGGVKKELRQTSLLGKLHLPLDPFCTPAQLPTLAGVLLSYPVVYARLQMPSQIHMTDCVVFRVLTRLKALPSVLPSAPLFSFTVPVALLEHDAVQDVVRSWKSQIRRQVECVPSLCDSFAIQQERAGLVALHF